MAQQAIRDTAQVGGGMSIGIAVGIVVVWSLEEFAQITVPPEPSVAIGAIFTFLFNRVIRRV